MRTLQQAAKQKEAEAQQAGQARAQLQGRLQDLQSRLSQADAEVQQQRSAVARLEAALSDAKSRAAAGGPMDNLAKQVCVCVSACRCSLSSVIRAYCHACTKVRMLSRCRN